MMPQQLTQLCRLMGQTQNGDYSITLSSQMFTAGFNFSRKCDLQESNNELSLVAGLSADDVKHFTLNSSLDKNHFDVWIVIILSTLGRCSLFVFIYLYAICLINSLVYDDALVQKENSKYKILFITNFYK